jgi:hypothetical protein
MARTACPPAPDDRDMTLPRLLATPPWRRLPAVVLNGMAVALGIGCIQWAVAALGGSPAAQLALSGAVCTSLADVPGTVSRSAAAWRWRRRWAFCQRWRSTCCVRSQWRWVWRSR